MAAPSTPTASDAEYTLYSDSEDTAESATPGWTKSNEVVRDLHRSLMQPGEAGGKQQIMASRSIDGLRLQAHERLHPEVGTASELAQPGGFRRAHLERGDSRSEGSVTSYRRLPLIKVLEREGFIETFITRTVRILDDGTEVTYQSRPYRRGAPPRITRTATGEAVRAPKVQLRFIGFRVTSVPYWSSLTFLVGAVLFAEGSFYWWAVGEGDAPAWAVTYPFFLGGCNFLAGCYLAFVEVINANLSEDLATGALRTPDQTAHRDGLSWWKFQPKSLLWWGAFVQLLGAIAFQVSLSTDMPGLETLFGEPGLWTSVRWTYTPSVLGSACFTFASYVYLLEVSEDGAHPCRPPEGLRERLGFGVAVCNLVGSILYLVASLCYYAKAHDEYTAWHGWPYEWEYAADEWGVRFLFGVGSICFIVGSICAFPEILTDFGPETRPALIN